MDRLHLCLPANMDTLTMSNYIWMIQIKNFALNIREKLTFNISSFHSHDFLPFMSKVHFQSLLLPCFAYPDDAIDQLEGSLCKMILTSVQAGKRSLLLTDNLNFPMAKYRMGDAIPIASALRIFNRPSNGIKKTPSKTL